MAASYPAALKTFTDQIDGADWVLAADINDAYAEIAAIETELGIDVAGSLTNLVTRLAVSMAADGTLELTTDADFKDNDLHNLKQVDFQDTHANGNSGANKAIDWNECNIQSVKLTANCTFTFVAPAGPCGLTLYLLGDATVRTTTFPGTADFIDDGEPAAWGSTNNEIIGIISIRYDAAMTPNYLMSAGARGA